MTPQAHRASASPLLLAVCLAVFLASCSLLLFPRALNAPIFLDEGEALERIKRSPLETDTPKDYFYAVDHPALFHWVDRAVLACAGVTIGDVPRVDMSKDYAWHLKNARIAPRQPVRMLRLANSVALLLAMAALFFIAKLATGNCLWAFALATPLVIPEDLGKYVGGYIKTDAYLAFFLLLTLLLWLLFHYSARPSSLTRVVLMGIACGLALSTKLNAGLILLAYLLYLILTCRGADRLWRPFVFCLVVLTVFVLVNPVLQSGGFAGLIRAIRDMFAIRKRTYVMHDVTFGEKSFSHILLFLFPRWYLLPIFALLAFHARREKWFPPVALWSAFLILGTAATVRQPFTRYLMPLEFGLTVLVVLSAASIAQRLYRHEMALLDLILPQPRHRGRGVL